ncbi:hypothetical protein UA08_07559 [Talaromyces atroroseus]|uniref:ACB domain-containing protein n=1 Tax=Talaromyces atroroseus TaxID=1441469 RepID=A0A225A8Z7_TALAT|nr:hypothetical protein UA08_07559 [Talaromyces atroroseus]OKL57281.1 hypothetical protein UA08_07559 [Talaromyces atroroseus]
METREQRFKRASAESLMLKTEPDDLQKLKLYGLYKQGSGFDFSKAPKPSAFSLNFKDKMKYNEWKKFSHLSVEEAQLNYIDLVESFKNEYGFEPPKVEKKNEPEAEGKEEAKENDEEAKKEEREDVWEDEN